MHRTRPRNALRLLPIALIALAALAGIPEPLRAQQPPAAAHDVEATILGSTVAWKTVPSAFVRVEIRDAAGRAAGQGAALADESGAVVVTLGGGGGPGGGRGGGVRPGYEIRLTPEGGATVAVKVPDLAVGADVTGQRVVGRGPAGASLDLEVVYGTGVGDVVRRTVSASASGEVAAAVAAPARLAPGSYGSLTLTTAESNRFHARFHVLEAEVTLGARQVRGQGTAGETIALTVTAAGRPKGTGRGTIGGEGEWTLALGGGGGPGRPGAGGRIAVGDAISLTQRGALPGTELTIQAVVPDVSVKVDLAGGTISGRAPTGSTVELELLSPYGETITRSVAADAGGAYALPLAGLGGFGRGWRAVARVAIVPGLRVAAFDVIAQVRIGVHRSLVNGVAMPGLPLTVTVRAADGTVKGTQPARSNDQGTYQADFADAERIAVGDLVEVELVAGDPIVVGVEAVSALTDAAADVVSGQAPAGSEVRVSRSAAGVQTVVTTNTDGVGRYAASFAGKLDIVAPMDGDVVVRLPSGHELFTGWAAVRMTMEIRQPFLTGNGAPGRVASAQLVAPDGKVVASGTATVAAGGGGGPGQPGPAGGNRWSLDLVDTLGAPVAIEPGDTVRADVGDDRFTVVVPPLSGVAFVAGDIVNGKTTAARALSLRVQRAFTGETASADLVADAAGAFSHDFSGTFDLQHNDAILFTTAEAGHVVNSRLAVPGLRLDLDQAVLVGSWRPNAQVAYELRAGTSVRASGTIRAGDDAVFRLVLGDLDARAVPAAGDHLLVQPLEGEPDVPLELEVPELTIDYDVESNRVVGRATPGGGLVFTAGDALDRGGPGPGVRRAEPAIAADGAYAVTFMPPLDVQPGTQLQALYRVPSGHLVQRTRYVPVLNVQHGGSLVCGFTDPRDPVTASLKKPDGTTVGQGSDTAGYDSRFRLLLQDPAGEPADAVTGQSVSAVLAGREAVVVLPPLEIQVDWQRGRVRGAGPANTAFQLLRPARGCLDLAGQRMVQRGRIGADGRIDAAVPGLDPGEGFELAFFTEDGHRYFRQVFRSLGQIYVQTDLVTGRASPSTQVEVTLRSADGTERGRATARATAAGLFLVRLVDAAGTAVSSRPGDVVHLVASGETVDIVVEDLSFDWSPGEAMVGHAPPDREVTVTVTLKDGGSATFTRLATASGAFRFGHEDVPPRSTWQLSDVTAVRASIDTPNGHQIISDTAPPDRPEPPVEQVKRIYLPRAVRRS